MTRTNEITTAIIRFMLMKGHRVWRQNTGAMAKTYKRKSDGRTMTYRVRFGKKGVADIIGCLKPSGKHIEIEIKQGSDKPTKDQLRHGAEIKACGGVYVVVYSTDYFLQWYKWKMPEHNGASEADLDGQYFRNLIGKRFGSATIQLKVRG